MKQHPHNTSSRAGQAMIELMIGVILILILLSGAVQFMLVADAHTAIDGGGGGQNGVGGRLGVRGRTGYLAMLPLTAEDTPRCIGNWAPGADGQRGTADDQVIPGSPATIVAIAANSATNATQWSEFSHLEHTSSLERLLQTPTSLMALGFVGIRYSCTVPVSTIAQELYYSKPDVTVQEDVWLPIMNSLY